ncbi:adenylate/guanylate cyclase domain-containing protein [Planctobacterium marinum]|uniref:Guanylate cyclase domain-containing protein n=1 Tax=Planctobacterium marinum TaxID=1631968 RepID=A0AA48HNJ2_9ALTE|nr:hypothetical protein MACH26_40200 [Planctobacterium marinum]
MTMQPKTPARSAEFSIEFSNEKIILANQEQVLLHQALTQDIPLRHECGGKGLCSTCRVVIEQGLEYCPEETPAERKIKRQKSLPEYVRLGCQFKPQGPMKLRRLVRDEFDLSNAITSDLSTSAQSCNLAVMFSDIRNFTEFSEQHLAYDVTHMLNRYFSRMTEVVQAHNGYVDKLLGDGMMVLFGVNALEDCNPCNDAVNAANAMLRALDDLNEYFIECFDHRFKIGIGIDYGASLLGHFGHKDHLSFTALGPKVNRAARVEALCKTYQCDLLITEAVKKALTIEQVFESDYDVYLKGISETTKVWKISSPAKGRQVGKTYEQDTDMDIQVDNLPQVIGTPVIVVAARYSADELELYVAQAKLQANNQLSLYLPKGHTLQAGEYVTVHLDNRTGVDEFDADLRVFRTSYKGKVTQVHDAHSVDLTVRDFSLVHGISEVLAEKEPGYRFPTDGRPLQALPITPMTQMPVFAKQAHNNKVGVLVTRTVEQPHTTVMAFLSTEEDDIFIISFPSTFKVQTLQKDNRCAFAIDERATFTFENVIEWNYVLIDAEAYEVPTSHPYYDAIKAEFINKNPWEIGFFASPDVRLYHLKCLSTVCPAGNPNG